MKTIDIPALAAALASTEDAESASALMAELAKKHGLKHLKSQDILVTDPLIYACDDTGSEESYEYEPDEDYRTYAEQYVETGEWGETQGEISVRVYRKGLDILGEEACSSGLSYDIPIPVDVAALIRTAAAGSPVCGFNDDDHEWTSEGEGGLKENPGVWSHGGTAMSYHSHCRRCGLHRRELNHGFQRNPGEAETEVTYTMLDDDTIAQHRENGDMDPAED